MAAIKHLAPATVANYVSGLGLHHKISGLDDSTQDFLVVCLLGVVETNLPGIVINLLQYMFYSNFRALSVGVQMQVKLIIAPNQDVFHEGCNE